MIKELAPKSLLFLIKIFLKFDLVLIIYSSLLVCPNNFLSGDIEKDKVRESDSRLSAHPTVLIRRATLSLLRCLIISTGIHADDVPMTALKTVAGLLHTVLDKGSIGMLLFCFYLHKFHILSKVSLVILSLLLSNDSLGFDIREQITYALGKRWGLGGLRRKPVIK